MYMHLSMGLQTDQEAFVPLDIVHYICLDCPSDCSLCQYIFAIIHPHSSYCLQYIMQGLIITFVAQLILSKFVMYFIQSFKNVFGINTIQNQDIHFFPLQHYICLSSISLSNNYMSLTDNVTIWVDNISFRVQSLMGFILRQLSPYIHNNLSHLDIILSTCRFRNFFHDMTN